MLNIDELTFIKGHEISHELMGHFDVPIEITLKKIAEEKNITGKGLVREFTYSAIKEKEIEADQYGILYTAFAGTENGIYRKTRRRDST